MIFLSYRLYRKNQELRARARGVPISQSPFTVDSSDYRSPHDPPSPIGRKYSWRRNPFHSTADEHALYVENGFSAQILTKQQSNLGDDPLSEAKHPHLAKINPGFIVNYRDRDDTLGRQSYRPEPRPPSYDKGPTVVNQSLAIARPKAYSPFSNWPRPSQAHPSSSIYSAPLPVAEDSNSSHHLPSPTSIARPKTAAVPNENYDSVASSKRPGSCRVPVDPGTYIMTPPNPEDDQGWTLMKPSSDGPCQLYPPPVPPKSPLRRATSTTTWKMLDVSVSPSRSSLSKQRLMARSRLQAHETGSEAG